MLVEEGPLRFSADGNVIIWVPGDKAADKSFGNDVEDDLAYAREFWKAKRVIRCVALVTAHTATTRSPAAQIYAARSL